jgi:hypothetical protein
MCTEDFPSLDSHLYATHPKPGKQAGHFRMLGRLVCSSFVCLHGLISRLPGLVDGDVASPPPWPVVQGTHVHTYARTTQANTTTCRHLAFCIILRAHISPITRHPKSQVLLPTKEQIMRAVVLVAAALLQAATPARASFSFNQVRTACVYVDAWPSIFAVILSVYWLYGRDIERETGLDSDWKQAGMVSRVHRPITWAAWMKEWRSSCLCASCLVLILLP